MIEEDEDKGRKEKIGRVKGKAQEEKIYMG